MYKIAIASLFLSLVMLIGFELGLGLYYENQSDGVPVTEDVSHDYYEKDLRALGYRPLSSVTARTLRSKGPELIYDATYSFDQFHRRITHQGALEERQKFAIFLGDSNTFGEGLNDDETLPTFFANEAPGHHVYNYAFRGYGPNNVLALLETQRLAEEVTEKEGLLLYPYSHQHAARLIGTVGFFRWADGSHPFYTLDGQGALVRRGTFSDSQPYLSELKRKLAELKVVQFLGVDFPDPYNLRNFRTLCASFRSMKEHAQRLFPEGLFVVVLGIRSKTKVPVLVNKCLKPHSINYIDVSASFAQGPRDRRIHKYDSHLNAASHRFYAAVIKRELRKQGFLQ